MIVRDRDTKGRKERGENVREIEGSEIERKTRR